MACKYYSAVKNTYRGIGSTQKVGGGYSCIQQHPQQSKKRHFTYKFVQIRRCTCSPNLPIHTSMNTHVKVYFMRSLQLYLICINYVQIYMHCVVKVFSSSVSTSSQLAGCILRVLQRCKTKLRAQMGENPL